VNERVEESIPNQKVKEARERDWDSRQRRWVRRAFVVYCAESAGDLIMVGLMGGRGGMVSR